MREWLLCGPLPLLASEGAAAEAVRLPGMYTDYLAASGGEAGARPEEGAAVVHDGQERRWFRHVSQDDVIDLDAAVSRQGTGVAYAYAEIVAPGETACVLALGSNDGVRVWLNGEAIHDNPVSRGLKPDHDMIPVLLRPGRNPLLLKIEERGNLWRFCCRLLPLDRAMLFDRFGLFEVVTPGAGGAVLRPRLGEGLARALVRAVRFEVAAAGEPERVLWRGEWGGDPETPIDIDTRWFGRYLLRLDVTLRDGHAVAAEMPFTAGRREEFVLFDGGRSDYAIVVGADASESEQWAARELAHWIGEASGAELTIRGDAEPSAAAREIVVGFNRRSAALLGAGAARPAPGDESFRYRNVGPALVIWGGGDRGTMYGVMSFLERELGVRFYTPRVTAVPKKGRYAFTCLDHGERPGLRVRNDFYFEAFDPIWAARNRINGAMSYRDQPGGVECYWSVHTMFPLMPPEEFFAAHPEYYSLIDGRRMADRAQLCLTNPDVLRILTERIRRVMRENPRYLIYSVSQNDWSNPCQCDACQAIVDREGSQSGPILWFVNQVADAVKDEFPDKFIGTLAYSYTRKPPRTLRPRENVVIRFCSIECCFAHPFTECPENAEFVADMEGWAAIAPHIYIWDYVVNFSHYVMPYPNFRVLGPNLRFFRDHNAIGVMEQAAYQSRGGEFAELRAYVLAKLLWDPEADVDAAVDDFMYGYYGRAGQYVRAYFDLLHGRLTPETHIHLGLAPDDILFNDVFVRDAGALFDRAEAVADDEAVRQRVELARLPVLYLKCRRAPRQALEDGTYTRLRAIAAREGVTHFAESGDPHREAFYQMVESAR